MTAASAPRQGISVSRLSSLSELPEADFEAVTRGNGMYGSARWLRYCEALAGSSSTFLAAYDGPVLQALAPTRIITAGQTLSLYDVATFLDDAANLPALHPSLVSVVSGSAPPVVVARSASPATGAAIRSALAGTISAYAAEADTASYGILYLPRQEEAQAFVRSWPAPSTAFVADAHGTLSGTWADFDDYLAGLSPGRRSAVRKERRRFLESGLTVSVSTGTGALGPDTAELQLQLRNKYGEPGDLDAILRDYKRFEEFLGDSLLVFRCDDRDGPVGVALFFSHEESLYARLVGFDYERAADSFAYFNLLFYEPLIWGIERGVRTYHYGTDTYAAKRARGCAFEPLWAAVHWPHELLDRAQTLVDGHQALVEERAQIARGTQAGG